MSRTYDEAMAYLNGVLAEVDADEAASEIEYTHDPDDHTRPGTDTHTDNLRGGYA